MPILHVHFSHLVARKPECFQKDSTNTKSPVTVFPCDKERNRGRRQVSVANRPFIRRKSSLLSKMEHLRGGVADAHLFGVHASACPGEDMLKHGHQTGGFLTSTHVCVRSPHISSACLTSAHINSDIPG
jgi:hypothetical protein